MLRLARTLAGAGVSYARLAWWGLVAPHVEAAPLVVLQGVVESEAGILLTVRSDLRGWELPGGEPLPGERPEDALRREIGEETGAKVEVLRHVGSYVRTGFRPHTAEVYHCRFLEGPLRTSTEVRELAWFDPAAPPETFFPWYRAPLADALAAANARAAHGEPGPTHRCEHQGVASILSGLRIDLRMRYSEDRAGLPAGTRLDGVGPGFDGVGPGFDAPAGRG